MLLLNKNKMQKKKQSKERGIFNKIPSYNKLQKYKMSADMVKDMKNVLLQS